MRQRPHILEVSLNDDVVGTITNVHDRNIFVFDEAYRANANRPILSLGFLDTTGGLISDVRPTQRELHPYFSNLLPEGKLREYVSEAADINPEREFHLLWALGKDLPGAVRVQVIGISEQEEHGDPETLRAEHSPLKFSLAGVQLKFSALAGATAGMTIPVNGLGGDWILKLPSATHDAVAENEFVMLGLAEALGIETPQRKLLDISEIQGLPDGPSRLKGKALAVRRYDRAAGGRRIHQEDLNQVFVQYPRDKYKKRNFSNLTAVVADQAGVAAGLDVVRRLTLNTIIGNGDMHLKNWSFVYPDGRTRKLAPAYDYVATIPYLPNDKLALNFGESKNFFPVDRERSNRFAAKARLAEEEVWNEIAETAAKTWDEWKRSPASDIIPAEIYGRINAHIEKSMTEFVLDPAPAAKPDRPPATEQV
jgi:serine/threonine-protein kinase HipA